MASFQDSPDEVILKVIKYLDINELVKFGEVSKRMRAISNDKSFWQKMNLSRNKRSLCDRFDVPTTFVKKVIENGCQYLSLHYMKVETPPVISARHLRLGRVSSSLRYLDLKYCDAGVLIFEEILSSCHLLQKLSMASVHPCQGKIITFEMTIYISVTNKMNQNFTIVL